MKLFALLAIVGMAAAAHLGAPGSVKWSPNTEYVFDYEGRLLTGIPELDATHFSGLGIKCQIHLQVQSVDRISIQIKNPKYAKVTDKVEPSGGDQESENWRFLHLPEYQTFPSSIEQDFLQPAVFEVTPGDGGIRGITVSASESSWTINIKKAIVNLFQTRNMEHGGGLRPSGKSDSIPRNWMAFEETIDGECETHYEMTEVPLSQANEEQYLPRPRFCPKDPQNPLRTNIYYVTKTRNLENCFRRPSYSSYKPGSFSCKGGNCGGQWARSSVTRYVVCGNPDNYVIQSIVNEGELHQDLLGYQSEKVLTGTRQVLKLNAVQGGGSSTMEPANPTLLSSAMYEMPTETTIKGGHGDIDTDKLMEKVKDLMKDVVNHDITTAGGLPEKDISMKILVAAKIFRVFNTGQLHALWKDIISQASKNNEFAKNVLVDTMLMSGSADSVRFFKVLVKENQLSLGQMASVFAAIPRTVATPTEELLEELFYFIKYEVKGKEGRPYHTALLSLSNLIQKACLNSNSETSYPTWYYGKFCNAESSIITEKWIPFLQRELEQSESVENKNVLLVALGLLSHEQILPAILPILEETEENPSNKPCTITHMTRYLAVYSLSNVGKYQPRRVLPILTALFSNRAERTEVRIAAFTSIMTMKPDMALLQKIATLTWVEDDLEVLKTVNTAFYSISQQVSMQSYEQSSSLLVRQVRLLYPIIKKEGGHFPSSALIYANAFFRKMSAGYERITAWIGSRGSILPASFYNKFVYFFDEYKFSPLEVGVHLCGVETVTHEILDVVTGEDKSEEEIKRQLSPEWREAIDKLRIKTREGSNLDGAFYTKMYETSSLFYSFRSEGARAVREEVRRIMKDPSTIKRYLNGNGEVNFQRVLNMAPMEFVLPSDMGLPIAVEYNTPAIVAISGHYLNNFLASGGVSSVNAKVHAFIDARVTGWVGTYTPVDNEAIITGIDQHMTVELPFEMEVRFNINEGKASFDLKTTPSGKVPTPTQPFDLAYYRVLPYTVAQSIYDLTPFFGNHNMHKISSGNEEKTITEQFGEALGLNFSLESKAETSHLGLRLIWEKLYSYNWNPLNFIRFFWTNGAVTATGKPSARELQTRLIFDPTSSSTKEMEFVLRFGYATKAKGEGVKYHAIKMSERSGSDSPIKLVSKPAGHLPTQPRRQEKVKNILEKINVDSEGRAISLAFTAALKGGSRPKVYSWSLTAGTGNAGLKQKWNLKLESESNPSKQYCMFGEVDVPHLPQWSISKIRSQSASIKFKNTIGAGNDCSESKFVIQGSGRTSEAQKQLSKTSPENSLYERLLAKGAPGIRLSELANKVRRQASALDIIDYKIDYVNVPEYVMYVPEKIMETVKVYWFPYYNSSTPNLELSSGSGFDSGRNIGSKVQTRIHTDIQTFDVIIKNSGDVSNQYYYTDIPLGFPWNYIFPVSFVESPTEKVSKIATGGSAYPTCSLVGKTIVTFDNKTVRAGVDQCMHLLSGDCGHTKEYGVFVRSTDASHYGDSKKEIKIFVHQAEVEFKGESSEVAIKVNGQTMHISGEEKKPVTNHQGQVVGVLAKSSDDVVVFNSPKVSVFFDGRDVIVEGSSLLKNKLCGLCGDNNNQKIGDLRSPEMCLLSKPEILVASYRVPLGSESCKPLPQRVAQELEKETRGRCVNASFEATKLVSGYESRGECIVHAHEIMERKGQLCFSKIPLVSCGSVCRPSGSAEKRIGYACMKKSRSSERIAEKVRRGEVIGSLKNYPTAFTAERRVPVTCEPASASMGQRY